MKKEKQEKLYKKYPIIFENLNHLDRDGGLTVGNGWYNVIDRMCNDVENLLKKDNGTITVLQVKEKFGTLRFYVAVKSSFAKEIFERVHNAETETSKICEKCGAIGRLREGQWVLTLCDNCKKDVDDQVSKGERLYIAMGKRYE